MITKPGLPAGLQVVRYGLEDVQGSGDNGRCKTSLEPLR